MTDSLNVLPDCICNDPTGKDQLETTAENESARSDELSKGQSSASHNSGNDDFNNSDWLPPKPEEPLASDCCGTGCTPCVFDLYDQEMTLWEKECKKLRSGSHAWTSQNLEDVITPTEYRKFEILSATPVSRDSWIYRFGVPENRVLGLLVGQHIILRENKDGHSITREYTPITNAQGYFDMLIKIYDEGRMSQVLKTWQIGQMKEWRGPVGRFSYSPNTYRRVVMLAAGTGIAPMLQVVREIVSNDYNETFVRLLYANRTYDDILVKQELDSWTSHWNFTVQYILSQESPEGTATGRSYSDEIHFGRIDEEIIKKEVTLREIYSCFDMWYKII